MKYRFCTIDFAETIGAEFYFRNKNEKLTTKLSKLDLSAKNPINDCCISQNNRHSNDCDSQRDAKLVINAAAVKLYGFSRQEFLKMKAEDVGSPADAAKFFSAMKKVEDSDAVMLLPAKPRKKKRCHD